MEQKNDFRELLIEAEVEELLPKIEDFLKTDYVDDEDNLPDDIWGTGNNIEIDSLSNFYNKIEGYNWIPAGLSLHISITDTESAYEDMNTRIILFDELTPVYVTWFNNILSKDDYGYKGIDKEGFVKLLKAALMYQKYLKKENI